MYKAIVVGTDGSDTAALAIDHAARLAQSTGAKLHIVSAAKPPTGAWLGDAAASGLAWTAEERTEVEEEIKQLLADAAGKAGDAQVETHAWIGDPVEALVGVAKSTGADLIVVGNRGMSGAGRILGSVPNSIAHHAPCSVLIVKTS